MNRKYVIFTFFFFLLTAAIIMRLHLRHLRHPSQSRYCIAPLRWEWKGGEAQLVYELFDWLWPLLAIDIQSQQDNSSTILVSTLTTYTTKLDRSMLTFSFSPFVGNTTEFNTSLKKRSRLSMIRQPCVQHRDRPCFWLGKGTGLLKHLIPFLYIHSTSQRFSLDETRFQWRRIQSGDYIPPLIQSIHD